MYMPEGGLQFTGQVPWDGGDLAEDGGWAESWTSQLGETVADLDGSLNDLCSVLVIGRLVEFLFRG